MNYSVVLTVFVCLTLLVSAVDKVNAQNNELPPLLVVTDLRTLGDRSSIAEAQAFSEYIRRQIENSGQYRLISRSSMLSILKSNEFEPNCHELPCFVRMGRLLGADQVLAGHLQSKGDGYEVTLRLIDVKENSIINSVFRQVDELTQDELLGFWGDELIKRVFYLTDEDLNPEEEQELSDQEKLLQVPEAIRTRYEGMNYIPEGNVFMGSPNGNSDEAPRHTVLVEAFYIGKFEVTNREYKLFIDNTGHRPPSNWDGNMIPQGKENHPVSFVSMEDAVRYCQWLGARLPTEAEWERAAKGSTVNVYPWGNQFDPNKANTWETGVKDTVSVGSYPEGVSPFGVYDMAGNVFEWVSGNYKAYPGHQSEKNQFDNSLNVMRGGSWNFNDYYARTTHRFARPGGEVARSYGFRIARDAE